MPQECIQNEKYGKIFWAGFELLPVKYTPGIEIVMTCTSVMVIAYHSISHAHKMKYEQLKNSQLSEVHEVLYARQKAHEVYQLYV